MAISQARTHSEHNLLPPQYSWTPRPVIAAFSPSFPHPLPTPEAPASAGSSSSCNAGPSSEGQPSHVTSSLSESRMNKRRRHCEHREHVAHHHRQQDDQEREDTRHQRQHAEQRQQDPVARRVRHQPLGLGGPLAALLLRAEQRVLLVLGLGSLRARGHLPGVLQSAAATTHQLHQSHRPPSLPPCPRRPR